MGTNRTLLRIVQRALVVIGVVAGTWAAAIWIWGGFEVQLGPLVFRSHWADRPLTLSAIALVLAWILDARLNRRNAPVEWAGRTLRAARVGLRWLWTKARIASVYRPPSGIPTLVVVTAIALAGVAASVYVWSAGSPFWLDEETIALNIRDRGFTELAGPLWLGQSAPLGWLIVQHAVVLAFGTSELALRVIPLAFGVATIGAAVWVGRRWLGGAGSAVLVLLCGFGQFISHYRFEVKHYTADTFWSLLLPAMVVWVIETSSPRQRFRRAMIWWLSAALGLWLANGAALVTPGCALLLTAWIWRRDGLAAAAKVAALGSIWLVAFGAHYELSVRDTLESQYLRDFWASHLPTASMGVGDRVRWIATQFDELARNPGSSQLAVLLWTSVVAGFLFGTNRMIAAAFGLILVTALVLGAAGVVPLHERLALWIVPALYVALALLVDRVVGIARESYRARRWLVLAAVVGVAVMEVRLFADVLTRGREELIGAYSRNRKHGLDDRDAVRWLIAKQRPGDAIITTHQGWPAIWWYGAGEVDGYEMAPTASDCRVGELAAQLDQHQRVLVYIGFRDMPPNFDVVAMRRLEEAGKIEAFKTFGESWAGIIALRAPAAPAAFQAPDRREPFVAPVERCLSLAPARRW